MRQNLKDLKGQTQEFTHYLANSILTIFSLWQTTLNLYIQKQKLTFMLTRLLVGSVSTDLDWGYLTQVGMQGSSSVSSVLHLSSFWGSAWWWNGNKSTRPQEGTCDDSEALDQTDWDNLTPTHSTAKLSQTAKPMVRSTMESQSKQGRRQGRRGL